MSQSPESAEMLDTEADMQRQLMALGCDGRSTVGFLKLIDANIKADPFRAYLVTELCSASRFLRLRMFPAPGALRRAHGCGDNAQRAALRVGDGRRRLRAAAPRPQA